MPTLIRFKRKMSKNNENVELRRGEPYYNLDSKALYVGNKTGDLVADNADLAVQLPETQKHIAEITDTHEVPEQAGVLAGDNTISFTVGEARNNEYSKSVNNVPIAKGIVLDEFYFGTEEARNNLATKMGLDQVPKGTVFFQVAEE